MGKKSTPAAPDYTKAAEIQAQSSAQNTAAQTAANRPDIVTPFGSQTWEQNGNQWTQTTTLSPDQQAALDAQMRIQAGRSGAAEQLLGQASSAFQTPPDYNSLSSGGQAVNTAQLGGQVNWQGNPASGIADAGGLFSFGGQPQAQTSVDMGTINGARANAGNVNAANASSGPLKYAMDSTAGDWRQKGQDAALAFMQPGIDRRQSQLEAQLANMGLTRGSEAWNTELQRDQDQAQRDRLQAFGAGQSEANMLFNQDLQSSQFTNAARGQEFSQNAFNANLEQQAAMQNAQLGTQTNLANAQMAQQAAMQNSQNQLLQAQFGNQAQQQNWNQAMGAAQFGNQAQAQQFAQNAAQGAFQNQAAQQNFQNQMASQQYGDQQALAQQQAGIQAGQYNQQLRQQELAEMLGQRAQPLNELNALLTGQQVGMPTMPSFSQAGKSDTTNYLGAAQNQYQSSLDAFNAQQQGTANMMNGITSMASLFSDERLKENIKPLFSLGGDKGGIKLYSFDFKPTGESKVGVLAQEVQKVMPEAVHKDKSGFLKVDYNKVFS